MELKGLELGSDSNIRDLRVSEDGYEFIVVHRGWNETLRRGSS